MNNRYLSERADGSIRFEGGRAADWLRLAAAPTFAVMALLTGFFSGDQPNLICSSSQNGLPLSGMATMYLMMSVFHLAPWLKIASGRVR